MNTAVLLEELRELDIDYVLISPSEENARERSDDGYSAIHGFLQDVETFERASIDTAKAVITDAGDANVNTILTVRSMRPDTEVIALTDGRGWAIGAVFRGSIRLIRTQTESKAEPECLSTRTSK